MMKVPTRQLSGLVEHGPGSLLKVLGDHAICKPT